jgi:hypothetical protein
MQVRYYPCTYCNLYLSCLICAFFTCNIALPLIPFPFHNHNRFHCRFHYLAP